MRIVNSEPRERGHQMFDSCDLDAVLDQGCAQHGLANQAWIGFDIDRVVEINASERNTRIFRGGSQGHVDLFAGV